jgi:hypothetical protein
MATAGGYDVFVSHCKHLDASEDRAVWVADVCEGAELKVFFDRSDLTDISEEVLERSVKESRVLVTVLDPHTFESDWVVKENQWAADAGRPIVPIYDGDRHRWDTIKKWCGSHPHVFAKQAINYNKDYRAESKQRLLDAVLRALAEGRGVERPPIAHAVQEEPAALDATPVVESPALLAEPAPPAAPVAPGGMVTLSIKVPPGCQPGEIIAVGHGGQTIQVACPPGATAGTILQVRAPAAAAPTPPPAPRPSAPPAEFLGVDDVAVTRARLREGIAGIYDYAAWKIIVVITATKDPNVVQVRISGINFDPNALAYEMRRSSSPMVWHSVPSPQFDLVSKMWGGAPIRYEFEPGLGAFTSKAAGKPNRRFVKRGIEGTYDGPDGFRTVITATADPNVVQARGSWGSSGTLLMFEMRRTSTPFVWNGVFPPHFLGGAPVRWEFEPGLGAFTSRSSTASGKPPTRYVRRPETGGAGVFDPFAKCVIS